MAVLNQTAYPAARILAGKCRPFDRGRNGWSRRSRAFDTYHCEAHRICGDAEHEHQNSSSSGLMT